MIELSETFSNFVFRYETLSISGGQGWSFHLSLELLAFNFAQPYEWRGFRQTRGLRPKAKRVLKQFSPHDWTGFKWGTATDFLHFSTVVLLLAVFLAAELNPFYLKVKMTHNLSCNLILNIWAVFALDGARSSHHCSSISFCLLMRSSSRSRTLSIYKRSTVSLIRFNTAQPDSMVQHRRAVRMGQHVWLLLATIVTELLAITKWGSGQYLAPLPSAVKWGWVLGATALVLYPTVQVSKVSDL